MAIVGVKALGSLSRRCRSVPPQSGLAIAPIFGDVTIRELKLLNLTPARALGNGAWLP
jgi:hypothetical protein